MHKVAIVTDSTANLTPEIIQDLPIYSIPQLVILDGKVYEDGVSIQPHDVYVHLKMNARGAATTSQTSMAERLPLKESGAITTLYGLFMV